MLNKRFFIPAFLVALFLVVPVMAAPAEHSVTAGGWIIDQWSQKVYFGLNADSNLKGQWEVGDSGSTYAVYKWISHSVSIDGFDIVGNMVHIWGTCRYKLAAPDVVDRSWYTGPYEIFLFDNGNPGTLDAIEMYISGYASGLQFLGGGNIQVK